MSPLIGLVGLLTGLLVGLTGVGGGSILTPLLVFLGVPLPTAVGTDLVSSIGTKLVGMVQHGRQQAVDWRAAMLLAVGGVPTAVLGSFVSHLLGRSALPFLTHILGAALVLAALSTLLQHVLRRRHPPGEGASLALPLPAVGLGVGFIVGLTSVGAGALVAPTLFLASRLSTRQVVGTDVAAGFVLSLAAGLAHAGLGAADLPMVLNLLLGSVPGAILGTRLTLYVPNRPLRTIVSGLVFLSGLRLL